MALSDSDLEAIPLQQGQSLFSPQALQLRHGHIQLQRGLPEISLSAHAGQYPTRTGAVLWVILFQKDPETLFLKLLRSRFLLHVLHIRKREHGIHNIVQIPIDQHSHIVSQLLDRTLQLIHLLLKRFQIIHGSTDIRHKRRNFTVSYGNDLLCAVRVRDQQTVIDIICQKPAGSFFAYYGIKDVHIFYRRHETTSFLFSLLLGKACENSFALCQRRDMRS